MPAPAYRPVVASRPAPALPACRLHRVVQYIEENLQQPMRLGDLSALVHMSPYHFARLFAGSTGAPPHRFIMRRRIETARALLATDGMRISEIARAVGFCTASHFATTFRRVVGVTPSAYRRAASDQSAAAGSHRGPSDDVVERADAGSGVA